MNYVVLSNNSDSHICIRPPLEPIGKVTLCYLRLRHNDHKFYFDAAEWRWVAPEEGHAAHVQRQTRSLLVNLAFFMCHIHWSITWHLSVSYTQRNVSLVFFLANKKPTIPRHLLGFPRGTSPFKIEVAFLLTFRRRFLSDHGCHFLNGVPGFSNNSYLQVFVRSSLSLQYRRTIIKSLLRYKEALNREK